MGWICSRTTHFHPLCRVSTETCKIKDNFPIPAVCGPFCGLTIAEMLKHQQQTLKLILFVESELESGFHYLLSLTLKQSRKTHVKYASCNYIGCSGECELGMIIVPLWPFLPSFVCSHSPRFKDLGWPS